MRRSKGIKAMQFLLHVLGLEQEFHAHVSRRTSPEETPHTTSANAPSTPSAKLTPPLILQPTAWAPPALVQQ